MEKLNDKNSFISNGFQTVKRISNRIIENEKVSEFRGWDSEDYPDSIVIGGLKEEKVSSKIGNKIFPNGLISPFVINLTKPNEDCSDSNIYIDWDGESPILFELINNFLLKSVLSFPVKYCECIVVGMTIDEKFRQSIAPARKVVSEKYLKRISEPSELVQVLTTIKSDIIKRGDTYSDNDVSNIAAYNKKAVNNRQAAKFLVLYNYPLDYNDECKKLIETVAAGNYCGIYTLFIRNSSITETETYDKNNISLEKIFEKSLKITIDKNGAKVHNKQIVFNLIDRDVSLDELSKTFKDAATAVKPIPLTEILENKDNSENPYQILKIPFGRCGAEKISVTFDSGGNSHLIVAGMTGSGKSIFLHTLVLSGAYKYSPKELEYYIIDLKSSVEFSDYADDTRKIPHIKCIAEIKGQDVQVARGMLKSLVDKLNERNRIFTHIGKNITDIDSYNRAVDDVEVKARFPQIKKMPRTIVIIDEYTILYDEFSDSECHKCLALLAKQGRSAGISLVLASQSMPGLGSDFGNCRGQINSYMAFNCHPSTLQSVFSNFPNSYKLSSADLAREKGAAYFSNDGEEPIFCRSALPAEKRDYVKWMKYSEAIRNKYPESEYPYSLIKSGIVTPFELTNCSIDLFQETTSMPDDEGCIGIPLGVYVTSGTPCVHKFGKDSRALFMIGDDQRSKNLTSLILFGLLQKRRAKHDYIDSIEYLDYRPDTEPHIALDPIFKRFQGLAKITEGIDKCNDRLSELLRIASERKDKSTTKPIVVILSCYDDILENDLSESESYDELNEGLSNFDLMMREESLPNKSMHPKNPLQTLLNCANRSNIYLVVHFTQAAAFAPDKGLIEDSRFILNKAIFTSGEDFEKTCHEVSTNINEKDLEDIDASQCVVYLNGKDFERVRRVEFDRDKNFTQWLDSFEKFVKQ